MHVTTQTARTTTLNATKGRGRKKIGQASRHKTDYIASETRYRLHGRHQCACEIVVSGKRYAR
jgi:hypothetical protein